MQEFNTGVRSAWNMQKSLRRENMEMQPLYGATYTNYEKTIVLADNV